MIFTLLDQDGKALAAFDQEALPRVGDTYYRSWPDESYSIIAVSWHQNAEGNLIAKVHCRAVNPPKSDLCECCGNRRGTIRLREAWLCLPCERAECRPGEANHE